MRKFENPSAQGDAYFFKIDSLPENLTLVKPKGKQHILAHSETVHHHVMDAKTIDVYCRLPDTTIDVYCRLPDSIYECFLHVKEPTQLRHLRDNHTHETILFDPGFYRVNRQREGTDEIWGRAID